jgi:hypothetical protein
MLNSLRFGERNAGGKGSLVRERETRDRERERERERERKSVSSCVIVKECEKVK